MEEAGGWRDVDLLAHLRPGQTRRGLLFPCLVYKTQSKVMKYETVKKARNIGMFYKCPESPEKGDPSTRELLRCADSTGPVSPTCNRFIRPKAGNAP